MLFYFHPGDLGSPFFEIIIILFLVVPIIAVISGITIIIVSIVNRKPEMEKLNIYDEYRNTLLELNERSLENTRSVQNPDVLKFDQTKK